MAQGGARLRASCAPVNPTSNRHFERIAAFPPQCAFLLLAANFSRAKIMETMVSLVKFLRSTLLGIRGASVGVVVAGLTTISAIIGIAADVQQGTLLASTLARAFPFLTEAVAWGAVAFVFASFVKSREEEIDDGPHRSAMSAFLSLILFAAPLGLLIYAGLQLFQASSILQAYFVVFGASTTLAK
ncbi:hypothetical protein HFO24_02975 [Rhizobium laguerreae]|uniref:hypothetical protein n=1 Tax=Rhizobium laguerreae TaxID=1076926 RepID=UPI001C90B69C|nr:hypothetical protein [Rhizobium laguerreae]MBY3180642.1 hypothetical protein [Rhizobium laguerreae]